MLLKELSVEDCLKAVYTSKYLAENLRDFVEDEVDFVLYDYLRPFNGRCADWSFGMYNQNFLRVKEYSEFLDCAEKMIDCSNDDVIKQFKKCKKMVGYNLFAFEVEQLADKIEDMIDNEVNWYECISYGIHCKDLNDNTKYILETFIDQGLLDDYEIDENGKISKVCYYN